jgi:CHAT domain-containing protein
VDIVPGAEHYGAYLLSEIAGIRWVDLGPSSAIEGLVHTYRETLGIPENAALAGNTARELESAVFEPVHEVLPDAREFYIAPDGPLQLISFNALPDKVGEPLIERFILHTLSTGRDLAYRSDVPAGQTAIVSGIEHFGERNTGRTHFEDLPGASREADAVAKLIPSSRRVAADRVDRGFLLDEIRSPSILHLATHGFLHRPTPDSKAIR